MQKNSLKMNGEACQAYLQSLAQFDETGKLAATAERLLQSTASWEEELIKKVQVRIIKDDSLLNEQVLDILNLAYNFRYAPEQDIDDQVMTAIDKGSKAQTLVVTTTINDKEIVLATLQLVLGEKKDILAPNKSKLEAFQLFKLIDDQAQWPHQLENKKPAELGRFAFHPLFDQLRFEANSEVKKRVGELKKELTAKLWQKIELIFKKNGGDYCVLAVMSDNVRDFAQALGFEALEQKQVVLNDSPFMDYLKKNLTRYFSQAKFYTLSYGQN